MERILYSGELFSVGEFRLDPGEERWNELNVIRGGPHVVFPLTSAVIRHVGRDDVLGNSNHVMFFDDRQPYYRRLHDPSGDVSVFVALRPPAFAQVVGEHGGFPFSHGPSEAATYLAQRAVVRHLLAADTADSFAVDVTLVHVVARAFGAAVAYNGVRARGRETTASAHRELVESVKSLLTARATERLALGDIARLVHTSEFHLARVFRAQTGFTLHEYRNQLRLRRALDLVAADRGLVCVAHELGYASHSHLTDSFRRSFGMAPSEARTLAA